MRLLPRKHVLHFDWLVHVISLASLYFAIAVIASGYQGNLWQLALICPLFIVLWYHGFWQDEKHVYRSVLAMLALSSWAMTLHWSGGLLAVTALVPTFKLRNFSTVLILTLVCSVWILLFGLYLGISVSVMLVLSSTILGSGVADSWFFRLLSSRLDLLRKQEEIEYLSRERERERIARDLHDVLGHTLSSIALKAELAEKLLAADKTERAQQELSDIAATARTALAETRQTVTGYRSGNLRNELNMVEHSLVSAGVRLEPPERLPDKISRELENLLSLVLREAVTNVIRHADASRCQVSLFNKDRHWHLIIIDDGKGWSGQMGNGLSGMSERLIAFGGRLMLKKNEPGTRLHATVPQLLDEDLDEAD